MESPRSSLLSIYLFVYCNTRHYICTSVGTTHLCLIPFQSKWDQTLVSILQKAHIFS